MKIRRKKEPKHINNLPLKERIGKVYERGKTTVGKHLWLELLAMVILALMAATVVFLVVSHFINRTDMGTNEYVTYTEGREYVQNQLLNMVQEINNLEVSDIGKNIDYTALEEAIQYEDEYRIEQFLGLNEEELNAGNNNRESALSALYTKLLELYHNNTWSKENVDQAITEYFTSRGMTKEILVEARIKEILDNALGDYFFYSDSVTYLVDGTGKIMYQDGVVDSLNLINAIQKTNNSEASGDSSKFVGIYPVTLNNEVYYLYNETAIEPFSHTVHTDLGNVLGFIAGAGLFILIIFRLTRDKVAYIEYLSECLGEISKGNLNYKIEVIGEDELAEVAQSITHMEKELKYQIEAQMQAEKSKNELVTNVAHDLRTPLTSIIGYIGLVKDGGFHDKEDQVKYLDIAYTKAEKLKVLIEDLFELTKFHQQAIKLKKEKISLSNLMNQLIEELMPLASDKNIEIETYIDSTGTTAEVDIQKMTRVFENLIENAIKYSPQGEAIYVELRAIGDKIYVAVSNAFENISPEEVSLFFERFYRADKSRNSMAGGSGLGLAIAKNIVELHGGEIGATINEDLISFKIGLPRT